MKKGRALLCGAKQLKRGRHCTVPDDKYDLKEGLVNDFLIGGKLI